jgi:N-carbamoyl-L-amino-acid hydrolase
MSPSVSRALAEAAGEPAAQPIAATSWAGHDAAILAAAGVPCAMLFVRSDAGGVSHAPEEATGEDAVAAGAGADRISSRDGRRDRIDCGRGRDEVTADDIDVLTGCESLL